MTEVLSPDGAAARPQASATRRLVHSNRAKFALAGIVLLGGAAPVAASQIWQPETARPNIDRPVASSSAPISAEGTSVLAVLRRPQTAQDRADAGSRLRAVGLGNQIEGLKLGAVRALPHSWALAPVDSVQVGPAKVAHDQLCITDGSIIGCSPAAGTAAHGTAITRAIGSQSQFVGIVPDGVARVRFLGTDGTTAEAPVEANFYSFSVDGLAPPRKVPPPPDSSQTAPVDGPATPAEGEIQWLDAGGGVVGPKG